MNRINEKPILFNGDMVRAILAGHKTMTRREVKIAGNPIAPDFNTVEYCPELGCKESSYRSKGWLKLRDCPYGKVGDRLWGREGFKYAWCLNEWMIQYREGLNVLYSLDVDRAIRQKRHDVDPDPRLDFFRWMPSIHMPRFASRILLEITNVRIERLQDITELDAINEGVLTYEGWQAEEYKREVQRCHAEGCKPPLGFSPRKRFRHLWSSLNGYNSWSLNPWVWVVEFKVIRKKGA